MHIFISTGMYTFASSEIIDAAFMGAVVSSRGNLLSAVWLAALVQSDMQLCLSPHRICCDTWPICRSDEHGKVALGDLADKRQVQKLDREVFSRAPKQALQHALEVLRCDIGHM